MQKFNMQLYSLSKSKNKKQLGWTREKYYTPYFFQRGLSNGYAIYKQHKLEDTQSSVMQIWGYANFNP